MPVLHGLSADPEHPHRFVFRLPNCLTDLMARLPARHRTHFFSSRSQRLLKQAACFGRFFEHAFSRLSQAST
jgi:hypothetical protein